MRGEKRGDGGEKGRGRKEGEGEEKDKGKRECEGERERNTHGDTNTPTEKGR